MAAISISFKLIVDKFAETARKAHDRAISAVEQNAVAVKDNVTASFALPKHGRVYVRGGGRVHVASAPGEPPAIDTGAYLQSWERIAETPMAHVVFTSSFLGPILEYGGARIAARPHLTPALEQQQQPFLNQLTHILD